MATPDVVSLCKKNLIFIYVFLFYHTVMKYGVGATTNIDCTLLEPKAREQSLLNRLNPLKGKVFHISEQEYNYSVGICTDANPDHPLAGVIQNAGNTSYILGFYNNSEIMGGADWIYLSYTNGQPHIQNCQQTGRKAIIMIICDRSVVEEKITILEERLKHDTDKCFYLFEMNSSKICSSKTIEGLSTGSVFCLIFFTLAGIYFLLGFLYQRLVVGAKGLEQIPNYTFWKNFGNLQADGCDYVCRCGPRQESQAYRGLDDRLGREEEERDDQLLTM